MAALRPNDLQTFDAASELRTHYDGVRARLEPASERKIPEGRERAPAPSVPRAAPPAPLAPEIASPEASRAIPLEIRDVVRGVATALGISAFDLMSAMGKTESLGRRVASALAVRRSLLSVAATAKLFGIAQAVVAGALVTLDAVLAFTQVSATHAPLDPLVRSLVAEWARFEQGAPAHIPIAEIQETVARVFGVSVIDMKSTRRTASVVRSRHVAMYLAKKFTLRSLPEIAGAFGGRDHTTVMHAVRKTAVYADAVALKIGVVAGIQDWARALRKEME